MGDIDRNTYLGKWSRTLGITTDDIRMNRSIVDARVTNGFIFELRYLMPGMKSDMQCAQKLKKLESTLLSTNCVSVAKRIHEVCEKIKKYLKNKDRHIDVYLAETFDIIRRLRLQRRCFGDALQSDVTPSENENESVTWTFQSSCDSPVAKSKALEEAVGPGSSPAHKALESPNYSGVSPAKKAQIKPLSQSYQHFLVSRNRAKSRFFKSQKKKSTAPEDSAEMKTMPAALPKMPADVMESTQSMADDCSPSQTETQSEVIDLPEKESLSRSPEGNEVGKEKKEEKAGDTMTRSEFWKKEIEGLARHPPDVTLKLKDLNSVLVCTLCGGYIYNATTIAECMHTFCRKCILFHIEFYKHCPTCKALIDESNPYGNLRTDKTYQVIVNKILPDFSKDEAAKKELFYKEQGFDEDHIPPDGATGCSQSSKKKGIERTKQVHRWISLCLQFIGYDDKVVPPVNELENSYLRVPSNATVKHLQQFLAKVLPLTDYFQALILYERFVLHEDLRISGVEVLFGTEHDEEQEDEDEMLVLQYGIVPKGVDYFNNMEIDEDLESMLDRSAPVLDDSHSHSQPGSAAHSDAEDDAIQPPPNTGLNDTVDESSNDSFTPGSKDKKTPRYKTYWLCCLCDSQQRNIYQHFQNKHKIHGDERRVMSRKCSRVVVDVETKDVLGRLEPEVNEQTTSS